MHIQLLSCKMDKGVPSFFTHVREMSEWEQWELSPRVAFYFKGNDQIGGRKGRLYVSWPLYLSELFGAISQAWNKRQWQVLQFPTTTRSLWGRGGIGGSYSSHSICGKFHLDIIHRLCETMGGDITYREWNRQMDNLTWRKESSTECFQCVWVFNVVSASESAEISFCYTFGPTGSFLFQK